MDVTLGTTGTPAVSGVNDNRSTTLDRLAEADAHTAAESLKHVIPTGDAGQVAVAAFASSI